MSGDTHNTRKSAHNKHTMLRPSLGVMLLFQIRIIIEKTSIVSVCAAIQQINNQRVPWIGLEACDLLILEQKALTDSLHFSYQNTVGKKGQI